MIGQDAGARDGLGEAARVPEGVGLALTDRQPPRLMPGSPKSGWTNRMRH